VVTGGGGRLGRAVVDLLRREGIDVLPVDRRFADGTRRPKLVADLTDLGQVYGALAGAQAVVHLGAVPSPGGWPPETVFGNNAMGQFHVFEAAARLGIRRVVSASSLAAYGLSFPYRPFVPDYLPLDEDHPLAPQDPYGLSKVVGEQIAASYAHRGAGDAVSLRITRIVDDETLPGLLDQARHRPESLAHELWSYVHLDDAARACLLALTRPVDGHVAVHVGAADTLSDVPSGELAARLLPGVPVRDHEPGPRFPLLDTRRASELLGFDAVFSWTTEGGL
jgi:nucleoside-diphosphate-sugar epimerase